MNNLLFIAILFLSGGAGLFAILLAHRLQKNYKLNYLSAYLYFQIFINAFGIYGIWGQAIVKRILHEHATSFRTVETIGHFFSFLGIPFLIFAWNMFIRLCREIVERKLSRTFNLAYFFAMTFVFLAYGIVIILLNVSDFGDKQYAFFASAIIYFFAIIQIIVLITALSQLFIHAREIEDENKQKAVRIFGYLNLFVYSLSVVFFLLSNKSDILASIYLLVFFSMNLPPLFYWRAYLRKHLAAPVLQKIGTPTLKQFLEDYSISRREEEVIKHLCEGKTNKEISKALFISLQTVKDHIYRIYQKTDVKNRVQLINLIQSYKSEEESTRHES